MNPLNNVSVPLFGVANVTSTMLMTVLKMLININFTQNQYEMTNISTCFINWIYLFLLI